MRDSLRTVGLRKRQLRFREKQSTCLAQDDTSTRTFENPDANNSFERLDVLGERRLRYSQGRGSLAKVQVLCYADECPQMLELHRQGTNLRPFRSTAGRGSFELLPGRPKLYSRDAALGVFRGDV